MTDELLIDDSNVILQDSVQLTNVRSLSLFSSDAK